jgi:ABC-type sugar transport system ATPase subunit
MSSIHLEGLTKRFGDDIALHPLDLEIREGELMVLVGPSGSGKSTALRLIAGLDRPSGGRILIGGRDVTDLPPQDRDVAMVFQSYALYPHMTVRENLGFGLKMRRVDRAQAARRVEETAGALGIEALLHRRPAQLSGGQRQRVALGRAIVREPAAFLLDEPLSNLDARLRTRTRAEIARLHRRLGTTTVYVTHDQTEAMTLGDRVAVLEGGVLQQVASPPDLYERPANRFVGEFIGSPAMNLIAGWVTMTENGALFESSGVRLQLPDRTAMGDVLLGVRSHDLRLSSEGDVFATGVVEVVEWLGNERLIHLTLVSGDALVVADTSQAPVEVGDEVGVAVDGSRIHLFDRGSGQRIDG